MLHREFSGLRVSLRRAMARIEGGSLTPERFALSVALGLFVGTLPLYGAHFLLCAAVAVPARLNLLVAYAAAHISIPPLIPFLLFGSVQLGSLLLEGHALELVVGDVRVEHLAAFGRALAVGSVVLGAALAGLGALAAYAAARGWRRARGVGCLSEGTSESAVRAPPGQALRRVRELYRECAPGDRSYVAIKLWTDPLTAQLAALSPALPRGSVVDAGCGRGQFSLLLAVLGVATRIVGFDADARKVQVASSAAGRMFLGEAVKEPRAQEQATEFGAIITPGRGDPAEARAASEIGYSEADLTAFEFPRAEIVLLLDVLHYLPREDQVRVLTRVARRLEPGGVVLVRETSGGWRAALARCFERVGRFLGVNRGTDLDFFAAGELARHLEGLGLETLLKERKGPLCNVLLVYRRPSGARE